MRNPFTRFKRRLSRYLAIALCTGSVSFVAALALLHAGFSPLVSLALSVMVSGLANYFALEMWATPKREGSLSWRRLAASSLVGGAAFAVRWAVLSLALSLTQSLVPLDKAVSLGLAYLASFGFGYLLRTRVVFTHGEKCGLPVECK